LTLRALRGKSGGGAVAVTDAVLAAAGPRPCKTLEGHRRCAGRRGFAPAGAVEAQGTGHASEADDRVVIFNTGAGLALPALTHFIFRRLRRACAFAILDPRSRHLPAT